MAEELGIDSWILHNNKVVDENLNIKDLEEDKIAVKKYFKEYVDAHTQYFETLEEKIKFLVYDNDYWEKEFIEKYTFEEIKSVFKKASSFKFRFQSYMSAFKFYNDYALKTNDKKTFLERYEDRLSVVALYHADGDVNKALFLVEQLMKQNFTPATPTLLNSGRVRGGEMVSCFLLSISDSLSDIYKGLDFASQLSKRGGGISVNLTNIRARGESIKGIKGASSGVMPIMKLFEDTASYVNQLGQRAGAIATYLNIFHPDFEDFIGTKKINADDAVRMKSLSIGAVIPDKFFELLINDRPMYQFYPKEVYDEYGVHYEDITVDMDKWYPILLENRNLSRKKVNPRKLLTTITQIQGESGYPYMMFSDTVNNANTNEGKVKFSNLCTEILQPNVLSKFNGYGDSANDKIGMDISCNLASGNIVNMMKNKEIKETIYASMDIMNSVAEKTNITETPTIAKANREMRSVGLGMMNMHGFLATNFIGYGSPESLDFTDVFFNMVNYYTLRHSVDKAKETGKVFYNFEKSTYADGSYFNGRGQILPKYKQISELFEGIYIPNDNDWEQLKEDAMKYGVYNSHRTAIAPNGSISYILNSTAGILPIKRTLEERTYNTSKTYYPMPFSDIAEFQYATETAYAMDKRLIIDLVATAQKHVDQGISFEICVESGMTTRDINKLQLYAWKRGIKTIYYIRTDKVNEVDGCVSCAV